MDDIVTGENTVPPKRRGRRPVKPVELTPGMTLDVVKYGNRRLYSSVLHRYISLEDVGRCWDQGIVVRACRSQDRSVDITPQVLMDMLLQRVIAGKLKVNEMQLRALAVGGTQ